MKSWIFLILLFLAVTLYAGTRLGEENYFEGYAEGYYDGYLAGLRQGYEEGYELSCLESTNASLGEIAEREGVIVRYFELPGRGSGFYSRISTRRYLYYKVLAPRHSNLSAYITPEEGEVAELALMLRKHYHSDREFAEAALDIVQQLKFEPDITAFNTKYPLETLAEGSGDCEDRALLLVSLLRAAGIDAVVVVFLDHVGAAVSLSESPFKGAVFFEVGGKRYYYCETTGSYPAGEDWNVGEMPKSYATQGAQIIF
jgi:transglutaminase-like putative cysteine protease